MGWGGRVIVVWGGRCDSGVGWEGDSGVGWEVVWWEMVGGVMVVWGRR